MTTKVSPAMLDAPQPQHNFTATVDPVVTDDSSAGYSAGSRWLNTVSDEQFACMDATVGTAVWSKDTLNVAELATVAVTGDYPDLINKPTILTSPIANADLADMAEDRIKGRATASTGAPEDITAAQARTMLNVADGANAYVHPNHTGDVVSVADGAQTIAAGAVGNTKLANMAQATVKLRAATAGTGVPQDGTAADLRAIVAVADGIGVTVGTAKTVDATFALVDASQLTPFNKATAISGTIPPNSSVAFPTGARLHMFQQGVGLLTVVAGAGVTIRTSQTLISNGQYSVLTAIKIGADDWLLTGERLAA